MTNWYALRFMAIGTLTLLSACAGNGGDGPSLPGLRPLPMTRKGAAPSHFRIEDFARSEPGGLVASLGRPSLVRWEGQSQLYQYAADRCVLDFYFRERAEGEPFRLAHWEARRRPAGESMDGQECLSIVLGAAGRGSAAPVPGNK